jgi:hypothetical protein
MNRAFACLVAILATLLPCLAEAGAQNIPCRRPFVFEGAAVNVVVLPYESAPGAGTAAGLGDRLSALLQLEILRSIAKFGSVGAVQMVGSPADCEPDVVLAKLLGRTPGAASTVRKGHGVVLVWGRFYNAGGNVFVQTFSRLVRSGADERLELVAGERPFVASLSAQAFAYAPRQVTVADLQNFENQFRRSMVVRTKPDDAASGFPMPSDPMPYWLSDIQGDWIKIAAQGGLQGWVRLSNVRDTWSLVRWLPEVTYIEGIVGYLRARIAAQGSAPVRAAWIDDADRAFSEYEKSLAAPASAEAPPDPAWRTALADAVQLQLRGIARTVKPQASVDDRTQALRLFERAVERLPHDAQAKNLVAVMRMSLSLESRNAGVPAKQVANGFLQALTTDPANPLLLANLQSAYEVLLAPAAIGPAVLTEEERREVSERLDAIKEIRAPRRE